MATEQPTAAASAAPQARQATPAPENTPPRKPRRRGRFFLILACVVVVVLAGAWLYWLHARNYQSTDDAFIDAHLVHVSPQITGRVLRVYINDNVAVHAGEVLVQLDPADEQARYAQAQAQVQQVEAQLADAHTQVMVSEAALARARADQTGAAAQAANAAAQLRRYQGLRQAFPAAVSNQEFDQAQATARNLAAQQQASERAVDSAIEQIAAARAQVANAQAQLATANAQLEQARLNLGYTQIHADVAGTVAHDAVAVGDYVTPGQELLDIVPRAIWVTANFKETQLALMRPGQRAYLQIDAYPDVHFTGHVDSIQRGAGQAFELLPPQNATGNFVKVVQRVPVKILIDSPSDSRYALGPGMSVDVTVQVRGGPP
ncbi:MAG TPA: HlyD family secretion protein [Steroidobacteraceae bacterium]|nr:HlyD family secretion protein [Steroidobacteraceae bacterium]